MPDPISWSHAAPYLGAALVFGYLIGSIPFGLIFARLLGHGDIRASGSGNIGATNALRVGGKKLGALTLLGDGAKGAFAVLAASQYGPDTTVCAGLGAFLGHLFPVWLGFRGGKGIATYLGIVLGLSLLIGAVACAVWLIGAGLSRRSSVGSLAASAAAPIAFFANGDIQFAELAGLLAILAWAKHHGNIRRIFNGTEPRIGAGGETKY